MLMVQKNGEYISNMIDLQKYTKNAKRCESQLIQLIYNAF
jgi:hypothetical protein